MFSIISTIAGIIGAFLVANKVSFIGYVFFLIGSFCGVISTIKTDKALCIQFVVFTICNMIGLYNNI